MVADLSHPAAPEFERFVRTITYKPGWTFRAMKTDFAPGMQFGIVAELPDSANPEKTGEIYTVQHVHPSVLGEPDAWRPFVYGCILQMERHEIAEFLQFGGVRYIEAHRPPGVYAMPKGFYADGLSVQGDDV